MSNFRVIGRGTCGTVFEEPGSGVAFKKGGSAASILQDYHLTNKVHEAIRAVEGILSNAFPELTIPKTPQCHSYHSAEDQKFWSENRHRFPKADDTIQPLFTVDHIPPVPTQTRHVLIDMYFDDEDPEYQQEAKDDEDNKDCLVRIYLGERQTGRMQAEGYDSLRNFPLRLDMIEDLELETFDLAGEMALGLATLHWQAQVDGMDVEFVLGSSATTMNGLIATPTGSTATPDFPNRATHLWLLDFDKAVETKLTEEDVTNKLVPAFLGNDPYYPIPREDKDLWDHFSSVYLRASETILTSRGVGQSILDLPQKFLDGVLKRLEETEDWNEEDNIIFSE